MGIDTWESYLDRFECFIRANNLHDSRTELKKVGFFELLWAEVFDMVAALLSPQTVLEVSWETILTVLGSHYAPKQSRIARRHAFHRCYQAEGKNISKYMAALRKSTQHCSFRELDDILLDKLVCRLDLSLQQAIDEAQAAELSNQSAAEIQASSEAVTPRKKQSTEIEEDIDPDQNIYHLRTPMAKKGSGEAKPHQTRPFYIGCGGNHQADLCQRDGYSPAAFTSETSNQIWCQSSEYTNS
ncbi:hypothetical protein E2320_021063, partial [Naja naja]